MGNLHHECYKKIATFQVEEAFSLFRRMPTASARLGAVEVWNRASEQLQELVNGSSTNERKDDKEEEENESAEPSGRKETTTGDQKVMVVVFHFFFVMMIQWTILRPFCFPLEGSCFTVVVGAECFLAWL